MATVTLAKTTIIPSGYVVGLGSGLTSLDTLLRWIKTELNKISLTTTNTGLMTPQTATKAPTVVADGMQRLARAPWRPIGGAVDAWVYYDAPTSTWLAL